MVLWKKSSDTMEEKLWYYAKNYEPTIFKEKKYGILPKTMEL